MAYLTQEVRELETCADWRVIEAIEDVRQYTRLGRQGGQRQPAGQAARVLRRRASRPGCGDLSGGERRRLQFLRLLLAEPNVLHPRRADQRPRHRDADLAGGRPRRLGRHAARRLPRPLPARADVRPPGRAARRRRDPRPARRRRAVPRPARRGQAVGGRGRAVPARRRRPRPRPRSGAPAERRRRRTRPPRSREARKELGRIERQLSKLSSAEERHPRRHGAPRRPTTRRCSSSTASCAGSSTSARRSRWSG